MKKEEILTKCRDILYGNPIGRPIKNDDFNFMLSLFPLHPRWKEKSGGHSIKSIIVRRNPIYNNKNFAIVLDDFTIVDISFIECVNRKGLKEEIKSACSEVIEDIKKPDIDLNSVIKEWLKGFDNGDLTVGVYLDNNHFNNQDLINNFRNFYVQTS